MTAAVYDMCSRVLGRSRVCITVDRLYEYCYKHHMIPLQVMKIPPYHEYHALSYAIRKYTNDHFDYARDVLGSVRVGTMSFYGLVVVCAPSPEMWGENDKK